VPPAAPAVPTAATEAAGARGARFHRARFVDHHVAATQRLTIHAVDGGLRLGVAAHLDETKALGATGVALHHHLGTGDRAELGKRLLQIGVAHRIRQVAEIKFIAH